MNIQNKIALICTFLLFTVILSGTICTVSATQDLQFKSLNNALTKSVTIVHTLSKTSVITSPVVTSPFHVTVNVTRTRNSGSSKTPTVKASQTIKKKNSPTIVEPTFGVIANEHLDALADIIGSRIVGSDGERKATEYIKSEFEKAGYTVRVQPFGLTTEDDENLNSQNIIAVKPGKSSDEIIIGAHYDSTGPGKGADDNAASVGILLEIAQQLKDKETPYTIRFIAFGSEEEDLNGSHSFVDSMNASAIKKTIGMINLDSLVAGDNLYLYGDKGIYVRDLIVNTAKEEGITIETKTAKDLDDPDGTPCDCADYTPFQEAGIPFAFLEATDWNLGDMDGLTQFDTSLGEDGVSRHTQYDTIEYLNSVFPGRINERLTELTKLFTYALTSSGAKKSGTQVDFINI